MTVRINATGELGRVISTLGSLFLVTTTNCSLLYSYDEFTIIEEL